MRSKDKILNFICTISALTCAGIVLGIFFFLFSKSTLAFNEINLFRFIGDKYWSPSPEASQGYFNMLPMLVGSFLVSLLAMIIATPLGILSSLGIKFYTKGALAKILENIFSVLAGIPSVVLGFWGIVCISPLIAKIKGPGPSLLTAALVLSLMVLPTLTLSIISALKSSSKELYSSSASLGMSKISTFLKVILPSIKGAVFAGLLLSFMRAIGETMVVTMLCGNIPKLPTGLFSPVRTLTSNIALEMAYAYDVHRSALFVSGLILLLTCTIFAITIQALSKR